MVRKPVGHERALGTQAPMTILASAEQALEPGV
jgi:hypothetical protein